AACGARLHDRSTGEPVRDVVAWRLAATHLRASEELRHAGLAVLAVDAHGDLAQTSIDRHRSLGHKGQRRRPADELLREVVRFEAELAAKLLGVKEQRFAERGGREQAVDVFLLEAGVVERALHGLGLKAPRAAARKLAESGDSEACDRRLSGDTHLQMSVG